MGVLVRLADTRPTQRLGLALVGARWQRRVPRWMCISLGPSTWDLAALCSMSTELLPFSCPASSTQKHGLGTSTVPRGACSFRGWGPSNGASLAQLSGMTWEHTPAPGEWESYCKTMVTLDSEICRCPPQREWSWGCRPVHVEMSSSEKDK